MFLLFVDRFSLLNIAQKISSNFCFFIVLKRECVKHYAMLVIYLFYKTHHPCIKEIFKVCFNLMPPLLSKVIVFVSSNYYMHNKIMRVHKILFEKKEKLLHPPFMPRDAKYYLNKLKYTIWCVSLSLVSASLSYILNVK